MNQMYEGKSLTAISTVLRKIKFIFYEELHLIGINTPMPVNIKCLNSQTFWTFSIVHTVEKG